MNCLYNLNSFVIKGSMYLIVRKDRHKKNSGIGTIIKDKNYIVHLLCIIVVFFNSITNQFNELFKKYQNVIILS